MTDYKFTEELSTEQQLKLKQRSLEKLETQTRFMKIVKGEKSSRVLHILPRQRGEVGEGVMLSGSGWRSGSVGGGADEC